MDPKLRYAVVATLAVPAIVAGTTFWVCYKVFGFPDAGFVGLAGVLAFGAGMATLALLSTTLQPGAQKLFYARVIERTLRSSGFRDGEMIAVLGPIRLHGEPILSPFTHTPCAGYVIGILQGTSEDGKYRIVRSSRALASCYIEASPRSLDLLSLPLFPLVALAVQGDSSIPRQPPTEPLLLKEFERVCAIGKYVQRLQGIDATALVPPADDLQSTRAQLIHEAKPQIAMTIPSLAAIGVVLYAFYWWGTHA